MKVLHITLGLGNGGAEGALTRLVLSDTVNEHVIISVMGDGVHGKKIRETGIELHSFDVPRGEIKLSVFYDVYKKIRQVKPDVIQTWLYHADLLGGILGKIAGVKAICWGIRHSNLDPKLNSKLTLIMAKMSALLSGLLPSKIISCSMQAALVHKAVGYKAEKFSVIPNGYDLDKLKFSMSSRIEFRKQWSIDRGCFVFGMVGRWNVQKDHKNLFKALSILKQEVHNNFKCVLVGPDIDYTNSELVDLIANYAIQDLVILTGPSSDVSIPLSAFDVLVLPSAGEAFPNVVAEAMACAVPAVVTDVGDAAFIVGDCGWVVPPGDSDALCQTLLKVMQLSENIELWDLIKTECRERVENNFSLESMTAKYIDVWNSSLEK